LRKRKREEDVGEEEQGNGSEGTSYTQAVRAMKRIIMFTKLRTNVLPLGKEELQKIIERIGVIEKGANLPEKWWKNGVHDVGLMVGVNKHGFGEWEAICSDPELPFLEVAVKLRKEEEMDVEEVEEGVGPKMKKKKGRNTATLGFPGDKAAQNRIDYLIKLVASEKGPTTGPLPQKGKVKDRSKDKDKPKLDAEKNDHKKSTSSVKTSSKDSSPTTGSTQKSIVPYFSPTKSDGVGRSAAVPLAVKRVKIVAPPQEKGDRETKEEKKEKKRKKRKREQKGEKGKGEEGER